MEYGVFYHLRSIFYFLPLCAETLIRRQWSINGFMDSHMHSNAACLFAICTIMYKMSTRT